MNRTTQAQVARESGVSVATVSRALAGDPRVDAGTASRVRAAAERLDYRPDPAFAWIANLRWHGGKGSRRIPLAFISQLHHPRAGAPGAIRQGAERRATELGYDLNSFFLDDYPDSAALQRVLIARGIRGLILDPFFHPEPRLTLNWREFCIVCCAYDNHFYPAFHAVSHDPYEEVLQTWRRVLAYGYRRPGIVVMQHPSPVVVKDDETRCAAALLCQYQGAPGGRVPPLILESFDVVRAGIAPWHKRWKPDVVIGLNALVLIALRDECRLRVPEQIGFAQFAGAIPGQKAYAGIKESIHAVGPAAVDLLVQTIHTNQWGIPDTRIRHYLEPEWVDGDSLPRKGARAIAVLPAPRASRGASSGRRLW